MDMVKLIVSLPREDVERLKEMADKEGRTLTYKLRQCIANESFFRDQIDQGKEILVEKNYRRQRVHVR